MLLSVGAGDTAWGQALGQSHCWRCEQWGRVTPEDRGLTLVPYGQAMRLLGPPHLDSSSIKGGTSLGFQQQNEEGSRMWRPSVTLHLCLRVT